MRVEVSKEDKSLNFYVEGKNSDKTYTLDFMMLKGFDDLLSFKIGEKVNIIDYIDDGDVVLGVDGVYTTINNIEIFLMQYIEKEFLIEINFRTDKDFVGELELSFSLED